MRRRLLFLFCAFWVVFLMGITSPSAHADAACDERVIDNTTQHVLGDQQQVAAKVQQLIEQGADVRVRAFDAAPEGSLDAYERTQVTSCASWGGGHTKSNLVVVMFSLNDRQSAIYYGDKYLDELDHGKADDIRQQMGSYFRNGDFQGGVAYSLSDINKAITPFNWAPILLIVGIVVAGGTILVLTVIGVRRRVHTTRLVVQLTAKTNEVKNRVERLMSIDWPENLETRLRIIKAQLDASEASGIESRWQRLVTARVNTENDLVRLRRLPTAGRNVAVLEQQLDDYRKALDHAEGIQTSIDSLKETADTLETEIADAPDRLKKLTNDLATAKTRSDELHAQGFRFGTAPDIDQCQQLLDTARAEVGAKHCGKALDELAKVAEIIPSIVERQESGPRRLAQINSALAAAHNATTELNERVKDSGDTWHNIQHRYTEAGLVNLESPDSLREQLDQVDPILASTTSAASMTRQDWDNAEASLADAERLVGSVRDGLQAITDRLDRLEQLERSLPSRIDSAVDAARAVSGDISYRDGEQSEYRSAIDQVLRRLGELRSDDRLLQVNRELGQLKGEIESIDDDSSDEQRRYRRRQEEEEEARRQRMNSGFGTGLIIGSSLNNSSSGGMFGGGSSGGWGGGGSLGGGGSSGGW